MFHLNSQLAEPHHEHSTDAGVYKDGPIIHNNIQYNINAPIKTLAISHSASPASFSTNGEFVAPSLVKPLERPDPDVISSDTAGQQASGPCDAQFHVGQLRSVPVFPEVTASGTPPEQSIPKHNEASPDGTVSSDILMGAVEAMQTASSDQETLRPDSSSETCISLSSPHSHHCEEQALLKERLRSLEQKEDMEVRQLGQMVTQKDEELQECSRNIERLTLTVAELEQNVSREKERSEKFEECLKVTQMQYDRVKQEKRNLMDELDKAIAENQQLTEKNQQRLKDNQQLIKELDEVQSRRDEYQIENVGLKVELKHSQSSSRKHFVCKKCGISQSL